MLLLLLLKLRCSEKTIERKPFRVLVVHFCFFVAQESCLHEKFVVFANEIDFQHHMMERHGSRLAHRKIQVSLLLPLTPNAASLCCLAALESHDGCYSCSQRSSPYECYHRHHGSVPVCKDPLCVDFFNRSGLYAVVRARFRPEGSNVHDACV